MRVFIALMAMIGALSGFSVDTVLPVLAEIAADMGVSDPNDRQWTITIVFLGMAVSQLVIGPASDALGRRPAILASFAAYAAGGVLSGLAQDYGPHLAGRFLMGLGAGGLRASTMAMMRDRVSGDRLAQVASFAAAVFIIAIIFAPLVGQGIAAVAGWRTVFVFLILFAAAVAAWMAAVQPESLTEDARIPLRLAALVAAGAEAARHPVTLGATLASGALLGGFFGYLSTAEQIYHDVYHLGPWLPAAFAALSVVFGLTTLTNGWLVARFGAGRLVIGTLMVSVPLSLCCLALSVMLLDGRPPLWAFLAMAAVSVVAFGVSYGNLMSLALSPLGHIAGAAAAVNAAVSTSVATAVGAVAGDLFDGTVTPQLATFALTGVVALSIMVMLRARGHVSP